MFGASLPQTMSSYSSTLSSNQLFGSSDPAPQPRTFSRFSSDGLFRASLPQTMSSDSSTLYSNQLFGSSTGSSLSLPAHESRARPVSFSVDSILADDAAPQTSMRSKKEKKKHYEVEIDPPDFFSSMITGM